ncbi:anthrone oxygenase family protein [Chitinophaga vietnamensis]|uniref:anthrone oxygenase family protein n=1 Tax=Chitinophaga vietnamensis TaxID=2593957 RepID=UPI001375AF64|nr:anthrone oxygenase family protein [Chitinophaga vietnamensis]
MRKKFLALLLSLTIFLSGLYAGAGFFTIIGNNPAITKMSTVAFVEYWKNVDSYMAARMPVFGPILLLSLLISTIMLFRDKQRPSALLMLLALLIIVMDLVFTLSVNHPLNHLIQSWDLHALPANAREIQLQVVAAFNTRSLMMIVSFIAVIAAVALKNQSLKNHQ